MRWQCRMSGEQIALCASIVNRWLAGVAERGMENMRHAVSRVDDVRHRQARAQQMIGQQLTMAMPVIRFGAHEGAAARLGEARQGLRGGKELFARHVIRVTAQGRVLERDVGRVGARRTVAAERLAPPQVVDAGVAEPRGQGAALEMRVTARARLAAHIDEHLDVEGPQALEEGLGVEMAMTDAEDQGAVGAQRAR